MELRKPNKSELRRGDPTVKRFGHCIITNDLEHWDGDVVVLDSRITITCTTDDSGTTPGFIFERYFSSSLEASTFAYDAPNRFSAYELIGMGFIFTTIKELCN